VGFFLSLTQGYWVKGFGFKALGISLNSNNLKNLTI
jgi:hypothetical protein